MDGFDADAVVEHADGGRAPGAADLGAVGEVAQVAEHAAVVVLAALLARVERLVAGVRADVAKDALEDVGRQLGELEGGLARGREERHLACAGGTELGGYVELEAALFVLFAKRQSHDGGLSVCVFVLVFVKMKKTSRVAPCGVRRESQCLCSGKVAMLGCRKRTSAWHVRRRWMLRARVESDDEDGGILKRRKRCCLDRRSLRPLFTVSSRRFPLFLPFALQ